jgi:hypothetical protein
MISLYVNISTKLQNKYQFLIVLVIVTKLLRNKLIFYVISVMYGG